MDNFTIILLILGGYLMKSLLFVLVFLLGMANIASADCVYDGQTYPEGAEIGGLVCSDGKWQKVSD